MQKKYQSEILKVIHQEAMALFAVGAIDEARMQEYDRDCLVSTSESDQKSAPESKKPEVHTPATA